MKWIATRNEETAVSFEEAFWCGIDPEKGLFAPDSLPEVTTEMMEALFPLPFPQRVAYLLSTWFPEKSQAEWLSICSEAFTEERFGERFSLARRLNPYRPNDWVLFAMEGSSGSSRDYGVALADALVRSGKMKTASKPVFASGLDPASNRSLYAFQKEDSPWSILSFTAKPNQNEPQGETLLRDFSSKARGLRVDLSEDPIRGEQALFSLGRDLDGMEALRQEGIQLIPCDGSGVQDVVMNLCLIINAFVDLKKQEEDFPPAINVGVLSSESEWIVALLYAKGMGLPIDHILLSTSRNRVFSDLLRTGVYALPSKSTQAFEERERYLPAVLELLFFELMGRNREMLRDWLTTLVATDKAQIDKDIRSSWRSHLGLILTDDKERLSTGKMLYDTTDHLMDIPFVTTVAGALRQQQSVYPMMSLATTNPIWYPEFSSQVLHGQSGEKNRPFVEQATQLAEEAGITLPLLLRLTEESKTDLEEELSLMEISTTSENLMPTLVAAYRNEGRFTAK